MPAQRHKWNVFMVIIFRPPMKRPVVQSIQCIQRHHQMHIRIPILRIWHRAYWFPVVNAAQNIYQHMKTIRIHHGAVQMYQINSLSMQLVHDRTQMVSVCHCVRNFSLQAQMFRKDSIVPYLLLWWICWKSFHRFTMFLAYCMPSGQCAQSKSYALPFYYYSLIVKFHI